MDLDASLKVAQKGHPKGRLGSLAVPLMTSQGAASAALPATAPQDPIAEPLCDSIMLCY